MVEVSAGPSICEKRRGGFKYSSTCTYFTRTFIQDINLLALSEDDLVIRNLRKFNGGLKSNQKSLRGLLTSVFLNYNKKKEPATERLITRYLLGWLARVRLHL